MPSAKETKSNGNSLSVGTWPAMGPANNPFCCHRCPVPKCRGFGQVMRLDECVFYEIIINLNILHLKDVGDESQLDVGHQKT